MNLKVNVVVALLMVVRWETTDSLSLKRICVAMLRTRLSHDCLIAVERFDF